MEKVSKSDWKKFEELIPGWRDRYLEAQTQALGKQISDSRINPTERFWKTEEEIKRVARDLQSCLDGYSKGTVRERMRLMLRAGIMQPEDLADFSEDLRDDMHGIMDG